MKLIIGLGNPGPQYFNTRHNFGFLALNYFQDSVPGFSAWQADEKFKALLAEGQIDDQKILLAKPQTFMNNSGQAVKLLVSFYKLTPDDIWILHDDLDLALGEIRISQDSGPAGHKGVQSIIDNLSTKNFTRLRLGIKPKEFSFSSLFKGRLGGIFKIPAEKFVLKKFSETEKTLVQQTTQKAKEAVLLILKDGLTAAQNKFN